MDTGASNHITGRADFFSELDTTVHGTVKFEDNSIVNIKGHRKILFKCQSGKHRALSFVYHIPELRSNIVSLGQLDENGCQVLIESGLLRI